MKAPLGFETGEHLLAWVREIQGRILRGDLMIGILDFATVEKVPDALRRAAECGHDQAWIDLADWLMDPPIGKPDEKRADAALSEAIARDVADADLELARLRWFHRRQSATKAEKQQVFSLLQGRVAADDEDDEVLYLLGLMTCGGFGTHADPTAAFELQKRAATLGNADAHFELYVHLSTGLGVDVDEQAAREHNAKAAEAGHHRALYNEGASLATGRYGTRDMAAAASYYQRACDLGNGKACATLAAMYAMGDGVAEDKTRAEGLFSVAESLGFDPSAIQAAIDW